MCVLADKEEIGSDGVTGMQSAAFDTFMEDLCESQGVPVRVCFEKSFCLSADVTAAYDPNFSDVYEKRNAAYLNYGIGLCKYTGARGKSGASDADAETVAYIRNVFDEAGVIWQIAELGKVDAGGGGTVAMYMANRNITTLDAGVPVLSMHAPFETVSKLDCYETYKGMKAVFEAEKWSENECVRAPGFAGALWPSDQSGKPGNGEEGGNPGRVSCTNESRGFRTFMKVLKP